jgi:hypothetical protein
MKSWPRRIRKILAAASLLGLVAILAPAARSAPGQPSVHEWLITAESQLRSLENPAACPPSTVCMELCIVTETGDRGTGVFSCRAL